MNNYDYIKFEKSKLFLKRSKTVLKSSIFKIIFSRVFLLILFVLYQLIIYFRLSNFIYKNYLINFFIVFNIIAILSIINSTKQKNEYKILWIIIFSAFPLFGVLSYFIDTFIKYITVGRRYPNNTFLKLIDKIKDDREIIYKDLSNDKIETSILNYLVKHNGFNIYYSNKNIYFKNGSEYYDDLIYEIKNAKKYIYIEEFIINDGEIWKNIIELLKVKSNEGLEIKILIDGLSTINSFGPSYYKKLDKYGIEARVFNRIIPLLNFSYNYRDHKKIVIIDGSIAYTGGINIGDEYANIKNLYGYFKDSAIKITGNAVNNFIVMYFSMWDFKEKDSSIVIDHILDKISYKKANNDNNGYIVSYDDYPRDPNYIIEKTFLQIINTATDKLYITTPYLIINDLIKEALILASKRGVEIKLIVPHVPDKKLVFLVTKSYYEELIRNNIKIYEYTPGFIHSKIFYQDDKRVLIGTANLDYRSMYLNFENMSYIYNDKVIETINDDLNNMFDNSELITLKKVKKTNIFIQIFSAILRVFAPLL